MEPKLVAVLSGCFFTGYAAAYDATDDVVLIIKMKEGAGLGLLNHIAVHWSREDYKPVICNCVFWTSKYTRGQKPFGFLYLDDRDAEARRLWKQVSHLVLPWLLP